MQRRILEVYFDGLCQPYDPGAIACYAYVIKEYYDSNNKAKERKSVTIHTNYGLAASLFQIRPVIMLQNIQA
jgi:hypothetical protein